MRQKKKKKSGFLCSHRRRVGEGRSVPRREQPTNTLAAWRPCAGRASFRRKSVVSLLV